jgi:hypothetical protein
MSPVSYQTIKLSKGKHTSPEEGACVMELASMLAGESFTDHPASVCPVIGSFLRAYNDSVDDNRRQDLYSYAAKVVGSRGSAMIQRARADRLAEWATEMHRRRWTRLLVPPPLRAIGRRRQPPVDALGSHAVHAIARHSDATHVAALALIDELLAFGARSQTTVRPAAAPEERPARLDLVH